MSDFQQRTDNEPTDDWHADPDPTPVVLPWWINDPLLTMTDGEKCIENVRKNSALYRAMIANGWTEVTK